MSIRVREQRGDALVAVGSALEAPGSGFAAVDEVAVETVMSTAVTTATVPRWRWAVLLMGGFLR